MDPSEISDAIYFSFAESNSKNWDDFLAFVSKEYLKFKGASLEFLTSQSEKTINQNIDFKMEHNVNDASKESALRRIIILEFAYKGAEFLKSIRQDYPSKSVLMSVKPLTSAHDVGWALQTISKYMLAEQFNKTGIEAIVRPIEDCFAELKNNAPQITSAMLMSYLTTKHTFRPDIRKKYSAIFSHAFHEGKAVPSLSDTQGSKPS